MTRSVNRALFHGMVAGILGSAVAAYSALQFDLKAGILAGINDTNYFPARTDLATVVSGNIYGSFALAPPLFLILQDNPDFLFVHPDAFNDSVNKSFSLDVPSQKTAAPERKYPGSNDAYLGLKLKGAGIWQAGYRSIAYSDAPHLYLEKMSSYYGTDPNLYYLYKRGLRHAVSGSYSFENEAFVANLAANLFLNQGSIDSILSDANNADSVGSSKPDLDRILRTGISLGVRLPVTGTLVSAGALLQNHLGRAQPFNIYNYYAALTGDASLLDNRFAYKIRSDIYRQDYLTDTNANPEKISTGFFQTFYLRDSYTLATGLFLKGLAVMTLGKAVMKQRYEFAVRKAWQNESWFDIGYFSTMGGLFPEQGTYLRTEFRPIERLGIGLTGMGVWKWAADWDIPDHKVRFVRAVYNTEISYRVLRPLEFYVSGDYVYFNWLATEGFPNRYSLAFGTRAFLP